jgi:hypothetical protein
MICDQNGHEITKIDFGNCYHGSVLSKTIILKNLTNEAFDIQLSSDATSGDAWFSLPTEEGDLLEIKRSSSISESSQLPQPPSSRSAFFSSLFFVCLPF